MIERRAIPGRTFRLLSEEHRIVGSITIPDHVVRLLDHRDEVLFRLAPLQNVVEVLAAGPQPIRRYARLCRSSIAEDVLELSGATIEQLREVVQGGSAASPSRIRSPQAAPAASSGYWFGLRPAPGEGKPFLKA